MNSHIFTALFQAMTPLLMTLCYLSVETLLLLYINKIQRDATVCRRLFTAKLLYMFWVSIAPIIRRTSNCNCSFWYRSYCQSNNLPPPTWPIGHAGGHRDSKKGLFFTPAI